MGGRCGGKAGVLESRCQLRAGAVGGRCGRWGLVLWGAGAVGSRCSRGWCRGEGQVPWGADRYWSKVRISVAG